MIGSSPIPLLVFFIIDWSFNCWTIIPAYTITQYRWSQVFIAQGVVQHIFTLSLFVQEKYVYLILVIFLCAMLLARVGMKHLGMGVWSSLYLVVAMTGLLTLSEKNAILMVMGLLLGFMSFGMLPNLFAGFTANVPTDEQVSWGVQY